MRIQGSIFKFNIVHTPCKVYTLTCLLMPERVLKHEIIESVQIRLLV